jgi:predicted Fe-Mo cluster-binding NifX family protein
MKIAFTSSGKNWDAMIDPRFGRTAFILVYDEEEDNLEVFDNREILKVAHGAGPQTAQKLHELQANVLVTGNGPGMNAMNILSHLQIDIYIGASGKTIKEAYQAFKNSELTKGNTI